MTKGRLEMKISAGLLLSLWALALCGCTPRPQSRDETLAVCVLSELKKHEPKDERPYFLTLKSVGSNLGPEARGRIIANIEDRDHRFADALSVDPKCELNWGQKYSDYRARVVFEIISWVSDEEVILRTINSAAPLSGGGATSRFKKVNGEWQHVETIESWMY